MNDNRTKHYIWNRWIILVMIVIMSCIQASESYIPVTIHQQSSKPFSSSSIKPIRPNILNYTIDRIRNFKPISSLQLSMRRGPGRSSPNRILGRRSFRGSVTKFFSLTNLLIASNVLVFLFLQWKPNVVRALLKSNRMIGRGQTYRLLTALFTHTAFGHIAMNCYSLNNIGPQIETMFGTQRYFITYLFSGIFANMMTFVFDTSPYSLGASGSIFGLIGALGMFYWRNQRILGAHAKAGLHGIWTTMLFNLLYSLNSSNIDNYAHLGGFIGGALICYFIGPRLMNDRSLGYPRIIDKPIINTRRIGKYLSTPFYSKWKIPSIGGKNQSNQTPKYNTVLERWFQSKVAVSDNSLGSLYRDDEEFIYDDEDYSSNSYNSGNMISTLDFLYSDDEKREARFRPSRDGM